MTQRICGKMKWYTHEKALEHLRVGKKSGNYQDAHKIYRCQWCFCWHVGRRRYKINIKKIKQDAIAD